ncbi:hypothetical protein ACFVXH_39780 [Kitasatospora sp. NPDC058184]|uniref:hypothetical protein n=1 Tax=Kitasatospora sp. NPDC058184 TaxID=3346370 RepID=UPI0036DD2665
MSRPTPTPATRTARCAPQDSGTLPVGTWAWPADGHPDCASCDHPNSAHPNGQHCLVAAADPCQAAEVCSSIRATSFRLYRLLASRADSSGHVTVTLNELRRLLPGPNGKPTSSLSRVRDALRELSGAELVTKRSGEAVTTSSRPAAADRPLELRLHTGSPSHRTYAEEVAK